MNGGTHRYEGPTPGIATVTLNPAIDRTVSVPGFAVGKTNRVVAEQINPGGKGINVAKALRRFGCPVVALGFLAGNYGRFLEEALAARGIFTDFVEVPGETRVNLKIKDPRTGSETEINEPGFPVTPGQLNALEEKLRNIARPGMVIVLSGSVPPGVSADVYARLIRIARQCGARAILDTVGDALREGIAAGPELVKPNLAEAEELLGFPLRGERELAAAACRMVDLGARAAVISCGPAGAVASDGSTCFRARPPLIDASSTIGSGDTMVAALAWSMVRNEPFGEACRFATAAGTATAAIDGSEVAELQAIRDMVQLVCLERVGQPVGGRE